MINSFHMNPWLYLLAIPISYILFILLKIENIRNIMPTIFMPIILLLLLIVFLYINNIIGLFDLFALALIIVIHSFLVYLSVIEDHFGVPLMLFSIAPIVATIISFIYNLN